MTIYVLQQYSYDDAVIAGLYSSEEKLNHAMTTKVKLWQENRKEVYPNHEVPSIEDALKKLELSFYTMELDAEQTDFWS